MFAIPYLLSPIIHSVRAFNATHAREQFTTNDQARTTFNRHSKNFNHLIKALPGYNLKTDMQSFFDRVGIRKDIIVTEKLNSGFFSVQGTNFFTGGDAVIFATPNFQNVDKDACRWILKHETSHIKHNDCFTLPLVSAIISVAAAVFSLLLLPPLSASFATFVISIAARRTFSHYLESRADDFAIRESTAEELKGGRRFLKSLKAVNLVFRNSFLRKLLISPSGENRLNLTHPSTQSRIKKIENALSRRNIQIDHQLESNKIASLTKLMIHSSRHL